MINRKYSTNKHLRGKKLPKSKLTYYYSIERLTNLMKHYKIKSIRYIFTGVNILKGMKYSAVRLQ